MTYARTIAVRPSTRRLVREQAEYLSHARRFPHDDSDPMTDLHVVVLAAGKGTRMKSALPKVLHRVAGAP